MKREDVITLLGSSWQGFESLVRSTLQSDIKLLDSINSSILVNSGKQLRPMLTLLVAAALGGITGTSVRFAAAAEILHNATLLHDDVADSSPTRRGEPTVYASRGASTAVLLGDYWLSKAVDLIVAAGSTEAIQWCAGTIANLARGEMIQMEKAEMADTTEDDYLRIVYCKTASLFETSCRIGAISAGSSAELKEAATRYGNALGMAFQIKDDIFDYIGPAQIGKPVGIDLMERKITLPLIGALRGSGEEGRIRSLVASISSHPANCEEVRRFVLDGGGIEYATRRLDDYLALALEALEAFPESQHRDALSELARYNSVRTV